MVINFVVSVSQYVINMLLSYCLFLCLAVMTLHRLTKRRVLCLGSACTCLVTGFMLFNQVMSSSSNCPSTTYCIHTEPAYQLLRRHELSLKVNHPLVSSVDINFLPSNSPNEDRYSIGGISDSCTGLFAVIDGHKSYHCSEYLRQVLLPYVYSSLSQGGVVKGPLKVYHEGDQLLEAGPIGSCDHSGKDDDIPSLLQRGFKELDRNISEEGLKCVERIQKGHSIKEEGLLATLMRALAGACALVAMVTDTMVYVASTGDCRAVMGTWTGRGWETTPLSRDQNVHNEEEVSRIKSGHPEEEMTVISEGRLLGNLMPFRSFGDFDMKWPKDKLKYIGPVLAYYSTPPYLIADPVVTSEPAKGQFVVLATDGLWDRLNNQQVVESVGHSLGYSKSRNSIIRSLFKMESSEQCCTSQGNAATDLLWKSLGGSENDVNEMLKLSPLVSRMFRDDITVIVVHFKK